MKKLKVSSTTKFIADIALYLAMIKTLRLATGYDTSLEVFFESFSGALGYLAVVIPLLISSTVIADFVLESNNE